MTLDEQHDFLILERLLPTKGKHLSSEQFYDLLKDITGNSHDYLKSLLLQKGYLKDSDNFVDEAMHRYSNGNLQTVYRIFLTDIGVKAYYNLKKKKCNSLVQKIAFWILFAASIISAGYAVATYYAGGETKNQKSTTPSLSPKQPQSDTGLKLLLPVRPDTTNPKKTVSNIDHAKHKPKLIDITKQ